MNHGRGDYCKKRIHNQSIVPISESMHCDLYQDSTIRVGILFSIMNSWYLYLNAHTF